MKQVFVRRKLVNGNNQLIRADVLSERDGIVRVQFPGSRPGTSPTEVEASECIPVEKVYGPLGHGDQSILQKCYPESPNALGRVLNQ